jgi:hypothetical protein
VAEAKSYNDDLQEEWIAVKTVLLKYPDLFPPSLVDKNKFMFAYKNVVTRCFGWSLPSTTVIPIADSFNHGAISAGNEMFDSSLHEVALNPLIPTKIDPHHLEKYRTPSKMAIDYSDFNQTLKSVGAEKGVVVKTLRLSDDVVTVCSDVRALTLADKEYDIWNV